MSASQVLPAEVYFVVCGRSLRRGLADRLEPALLEERRRAAVPAPQP